MVRRKLRKALWITAIALTPYAIWTFIMLDPTIAFSGPDTRFFLVFFTIAAFYVSHLALGLDDS